ncbi:DNA repair protein, partial [Candidatus Saccharibacteria bacterium]|nr:DNA repair protein [Candidatus Saccharibacteria bacterium]
LVSAKSLHQSSLFELVEPKTDQKIQTAMLDITRRFGKNAIMRGEDLEEHATTRLRNNQIGGHRSA